MERLTKRIDEQHLCIEVCEETCIEGNTFCPKCKPFTAVLKKLMEYEDLEEQGLLIKLPCKVGDVVCYFKTLNDGENTIVIEEFKIHMFSFTNAGLFLIDNFRHSLCVDLLNETFFLTKSEAEKALAEMEK